MLEAFTQSDINRIGDYEILGVLGAGGMGKVYRVRNVISDRIEAMKILLPSLSDHREVGDRFLREIKLVASLHHPNIANLCTAQTLENHLIMVMEFVDGDTFSDLLDRRAVPLKDALNYFDQALAALSYAHGKGIVHRDIKPSNLMLTPDGIVKLMDFGIARSEADRALTQTGATIGTVSHMSPEQIAGKPTDGRSDLYSMGILIYETVTGEQPFKGTSDYELMAAHINQAPRPPAEFVPGIPDGLNRIILKLLSKAPEDRFQTAEAVREAIRSLEDFSSVTRGLPKLATAPAAPVTRSATMVEGLSTRPSDRMLTTLEPRSTGTQVKNAYTERRMTEVAGMQTYTQPSSTPLALQKKGLSRHPALYLGGGLALTVSAIAVPLMLHRDKAVEKTVINDAAVSPSAPLATASPVATLPLGAESKPPVLPPNGVPPSAAGSLSMQASMPQASRGALVSGKASSAVAVPLQASGAPAVGGQQGPAPISPELKAKLDEEEIQIDQLSSRAVAINNSLNTMQRSMQKDGLSLRVDIASKQSSMNANLSKAQSALIAHEADRVSRFAAMAETEEGELESFLGK